MEERVKQIDVELDIAFHLWKKATLEKKEERERSETDVAEPEQKV